MARGADAAPPMGALGDGEHTSLTDALPTEMVCRIVSLFRARPGDWMALLLTSRTMAAACRATLDPASDRVHCGAAGAGPTLAARLVDRYAKDVPAVLDAYRCANASALLVEACRAGDLVLTRTLLDGRDRWRVDVSYRHNRPLLECVRLNSAIGVQMLLATGRADPVDHPGAAHLGRCALHQEPACRRPDHPALCDMCARGQPGGPWSDSDDDDDDDHANDDDDGPDDAHRGYLDDYDDDPLADTDEDDDDGDDDGNDNDDGRDPRTTGQESADDDNVRAVPIGPGQAPTAMVPAAHSHGGDGDFEVDYGALFDGEDGGGDNDRDYEPHASVYASLVDNDDDDDDDNDIAESHRNHRNRDRGRIRGGDDEEDEEEDEDEDDEEEEDDGPESGDDKEVGGMGLWTGDRDDLAAAVDVRDDDDDNGWGDEPRHEAVAWEGAADPATAPAHILPAGSGSGHALAVRRANLARCVCRRGMTFAIVWIDDEGREIGGRAQGPASEPLWFLVCEDPTALVADGPLSFLTAHAHPPSRPAVPLWYRDDHLNANGADDTRGGVNDDHNGADGGSAVVGRAIHMFAMGQGAPAVDNGDRNRDANIPHDADDEGDDNKAESIDRVDGGSPIRETSTPSGDRVVGPAIFHADGGNDNSDTSAHYDEHGDGRTAAPSEPPDAGATALGGVAVVEGQAALWIDGSGRVMARIPCTCASDGRPFYTQAMQRWCPLFWAALMSVGVLGQLLGHVGAATVADRPGAGAERRWACRPADVLMLAVAQMVVFSSVSHMASLSDLHAAALDLMLRAGAIDLAAHGDFLVAFAADRGCSEIIEMLVEYGGGTKGVIDVTAHGDLALRRALWRYVRLYRPAFGAGARLEPEERSSRMCLYAAVLVALASAAGLDTGGMDPTDALMEPLDPGFVRALARRVYPGMTANEIGRLRLPPLRPHYPPPFTPPS